MLEEDEAIHVEFNEITLLLKDGALRFFKKTPKV